VIGGGQWNPPFRYYSADRVLAFSRTSSMPPTM
jgi:hypothetical protein